MGCYEDLKGKTALVTGASNGIGAEAAALLAASGVFTLIHYHRARDEAEKVLARIRDAGSDGRSSGLTCRTWTAAGG